MAIAIDWLDAYRSANLDAILSLYDDEASLECGCDGRKILVGKIALEKYWSRRFTERPALDLDDLQPDGEGVALAYNTSDGVVRTTFAFNALGKITRTRCGPSAQIEPLRRR